MGYNTSIEAEGSSQLPPALADGIVSLYTADEQPGRRSDGQRTQDHAWRVHKALLAPAT